MFGGVVLCEIATQGWFAWREAGVRRGPDVSVRWREDARDYQTTAIAPATHRLLGDVNSRSGAWRDDRGWRWNALWFQYPPQAANRNSTEVHNPEVCLPAAGAHEKADYGTFPGQNAAAALRIHSYLFSNDTGRAYVFWISSFAPPEEGEERLGDGNVVYQPGLAALAGRFRLWCREIWCGVRRSNAQTLEVSIRGASDYASARAAFLDFLSESITETFPRPSSPESR